MHVTPISFVPGKPRFNWSHAYPSWLKSDHKTIVKAVARYGFVDSVQLERLTGWPKIRVHRLTKTLHQNHFIRSFLRGHLGRTEGTRRASIWGLLPRGAWLMSLETSIPFDCFKTYQNASPAYANAEHDIDLTDIRISFELHAKLANIELAEWKTEADWRVGEALVIPSLSRTKPIHIIPDGSVILSDRHGHKSYVFVEADRTNRNNWPDKIRAYKNLWSMGAFLNYFNISDTSTGFRVVVTTKTRSRAHYLKAQVETVGRADLAGLFLFVPIEEVAKCSNIFTSKLWGRGGVEVLQPLYDRSVATEEIQVFDSKTYSIQLAFETM